jgi:hypothetical protein
MLNQTEMNEKGYRVVSAWARAQCKNGRMDASRSITIRFLLLRSVADLG